LGQELIGRGIRRDKNFQFSCPCFLFSGCSHMSISEKGHIFNVAAQQDGEKNENALLFV